MKRFFSVLAITGAMVVSASSLKGAWIEGGNPLPVAFSNMVIFDSAGTYTWTVPDGVYKIKVEMRGAGGGGAYNGSYGDYYYYCGGGGGGYGLVVMDVTPGQVCAITVGAGGSSGADGGNTIIVCGTTTYTAYGGGGASISSSSCDAGRGDTATTPFFLKGEDGGRYRWTSSDRLYKGFAHGGSSPRGGFGGFWDNSSPYDSRNGSWPGGGGFDNSSGADGAVIIWY